MSSIFLLKGVVKHYDWGGNSFLPQFLGFENTENKPCAEYWMGIHPLGLATVILENGEEIELNKLTAPLSYLFKVLDVKDMLSIQVHPSKKAAEIDFAKENELGIPIDSLTRNYKDDNHKPELMVALSDFWLLHGFKPAEELAETLINIEELRVLIPVFQNEGYNGLYRYIMELPQDDVNKILKPLIEGIDEKHRNGELKKSEEDFWAARAAHTFNKDGNFDRGIFSIYLFNLVHLRKGEAIFQDAGVPHAYLEGQNIEIMANSDNVLRGGLTSKNIDVKELLKHTKCEPVWPQIITGEKDRKNEKQFKVPVPDFTLGEFELQTDEKAVFLSEQCEIILVASGNVLLHSGEKNLQLVQGMSAVVLEGNEVTITANTDSSVFRAGSAVHIRE